MTIQEIPVINTVLNMLMVRVIFGLVQQVGGIAKIVKKDVTLIVMTPEGYEKALAVARAGGQAYQLGADVVGREQMDDILAKCRDQ